MPLALAVDYAAGRVAFPSPRPQREGNGRGGANPLSGREQEVARLIVQGLSNREIAKTLTISERTVDAHVQHILNKLGFNSRAQIAAWVAASSPDAATPAASAR
jgi:non-specific serine/threonine protein kinase